MRMADVLELAQCSSNLLYFRDLCFRFASVPFCDELDNVDGVMRPDSYERKVL
jgi:hypothetical protein